MKIRSKALYDYLLQSGALNGTPEQVAHHKKLYRNSYKRNWKLKKRPRKELRIIVTLKQYEAIKHKATIAELRPTSFCRSALLAAVEENFSPLSTDKMLKALQLVSMATIGLIKANRPITEVIILLETAEAILIDYGIRYTEHP